jgi:hypothetical protein
VIGSWYCLPEDELSAAALAEYAEDGFTHFQTLDLVDGRWTPYSNAGNRRALDLCAEVGLRCFVVDGRLYRGERPYLPEHEPTDADVDAVCAAYADHLALAGYLLYDEPSPHAFPMLARTIARLRGRDADAIALIPLFPMHDDPRFRDAFEGRGYGEYVRQFVDVCRPDVLALDYYPFFDPPGRMLQFLENLAIVRDAGLPFWYYGAIVAGAPAWVEPTEERIRFQVDAALDHGASGIFHFTYRSAHRAPRGVVQAVNQAVAPRLNRR